MSQCAYTGCLAEETIAAWEWRALLQLAQQHDLNHAGYCDPRMGCINFWCGPDDKPSDPTWNQVNIQAFALKFPRAYVGGVYGDYLEAASATDKEEQAIQRSFGLGGLTEGNPEALSRLGGQVQLHWVIDPREKAEAITGKNMFGSTVIYKGKQVKVENFASPADLEWCQAKFQELRRQLKRS